MQLQARFPSGVVLDAFGNPIHPWANTTCISTYTCGPVPQLSTQTHSIIPQHIQSAPITKPATFWQKLDAWIFQKRESPDNFNELTQTRG